MSRLLFLLFILVTFSFGAQKTLRVGIDEWPPFVFTDKHPAYGIDIDLFKELAKRLNLKIEFVDVPWARLLQQIKEGKLDALSSVAISTERKRFINYLKPAYYKLSSVFYVPKGQEASISSYQDLQNKRIGIVRDSVYFSPFDKDISLQKIAVVYEDQLIDMLRFKRIDAFVGTNAQADYHIALKGFENSIVKANYRPNNEVRIHIGLSKKSAFSKELERFNQALADIIADKTLENISKRYFKK